MERLTLLTRVIEALNESGVSVERAYSGQPMPHVEGFGARARIMGVDSENQTIRIGIEAFCSAQIGAGWLSEATLMIGMIVEQLGATWKVSDCVPCQQGELLKMEVTASFSADAAGWPVRKIPITVALGGITLHNLTNFTSWQELDPDLGDAIHEMGWTFRIEEFHASGIVSEGSPNEPFDIVVTREGMTETYKNCRWTTHERRDDIDGLRLVRTGTADKRSFSAYL